MKKDNVLEQNPDWGRRRDIPLAILAWLGLFAVSIWLLSYIGKSLVLIAVAAFFAYALAPVVAFLSRFIPRFLSIALVYLVVLGSLGILLYLVVSSAVGEFSSLARTFDTLVVSHNGHQTPLMQTLQRFGISDHQLDIVGQQLTSQAEHLTGSIIPLLSSVASFLIDFILIAIVSIYLLIDGQRIKAWMMQNVPLSYKGRLRFLLATFERVVGGYIKGQVFLAVLIGVLVGGGLAIFHVPYALLLGVVAFLLEFIPIIGVFISGALAALLGLTQGWLIALFVVIYFIVIHIVEGDILGPKVVGRALGLHPLISIIALLIGTELFGIAGALFAAPAAGILQAVLVAIWSEWKLLHPEVFAGEQH